MFVGFLFVVWIDKQIFNYDRFYDSYLFIFLHSNLIQYANTGQDYMLSLGEVVSQCLWINDAFDF